MMCCSDNTKECVCGEGECATEECCGSCMSVQDATAGKTSRVYSGGLAPGKLVMLITLSGGLYIIYWLFCNWRNIKVHTNAKFSPIGRTIAFLFPAVDIILFCLLLKNIHTLAKKEGTRLFPLVWTCIGGALLCIAGWAAFVGTFFMYGPDLYFLFYVYMIGVGLFAVMLLPAQLSLNAFWEHVQGAPTRERYTSGEKAWLVVGSLLLFFDFLSIFLLPPPPYSEPALDYYPAGYSAPLNDVPSDLQTPSEEQPPTPSAEPAQ